MRIPRIFSEQKFSVGQSLNLDAFASGHICRVLRMKSGRPLILFNGQGGEYSAVLRQADPKSALVEVLDFDPVERESNLEIHLGLGLSRGDRFDWAIQKSVELGVLKITPLVCARSDKIADNKRLQRKMEHWQRLVISACEQSGRTRLAEISEPLACAEWAADRIAKQTYFFVPGAQALGELLTDASRNQDKESATAVCLAIGPEGGFSDSEESHFDGQGFQRASLGPRILRTETAPLLAIGLFQYLLGDIS